LLLDNIIETVVINYLHLVMLVKGRDATTWKGWSGFTSKYWNVPSKIATGKKWPFIMAPQMGLN